MARSNPFGKIKDLSVGTVKGAASVGKQLAGQATKSATTLTAGTVGRLVHGRTASDATDASEAPATTPTPVNVTEELGLDPAPVAKTEPEPVTSIDAAADVEHVEATPADIAKVVAKKAPRTAPAPTSPSAKKAGRPAKASSPKSGPGDKLPPRKPVEETEEAGVSKG